MHPINCFPDASNEGAKLFSLARAVHALALAEQYRLYTMQRSAYILGGKSCSDVIDMLCVSKQASYEAQA